VHQECRPWPRYNRSHQPYVQYDLVSGRYLFDDRTIGEGKDIRWYQQSNDPRFNRDFYTAESLRSVSER